MVKNPHSSNPSSNNSYLSSLQSKSKNELIRMILSQDDIQIPVTVFSTNLSPLTSVVKYLKETIGMPVDEIALKLNRHKQTIWTIYHLGKDEKLNIETCEFYVPLSVLSKNQFSILESIIPYLMKKYQLKMSQLALILNKSVKTVWTCNARFQAKGGKQ